MMKIHTALLFSMLACFSGVSPSLAADEPRLPPLQLKLRGVDVSSSVAELLREKDSGRSMAMGFVLADMPGWRVAWCEEQKARVTIEDSKGGAWTDVECSYSGFPSSSLSGLTGLIAHQQIALSSRSWLPSFGAQWVRVTGEIPFAVFCGESVTEPVTVRLTKGFSVPVVLKGAGLAGGDGKGADVEAVLTVEGYEDADSKGTRKKLSLKLTANQPLGCQACELVLMDGLPAGTVYERSRHGGEKTGFGWEWSAELASVKEQELKIMVRHADSPRRVMARVDAVAALSGFSEGDVIARQNTCSPVKAGDPVEKKAHGELELPDRGKTMAGNGGPDEITVEWVGCHLGIREAWLIDEGQEAPQALGWQMRLKTPLPAGFCEQEVMKQNLEVTDSSGRVLKPAVCELFGLGQDEKQGLSSACVNGTIPEWASPGAEWVRVQGDILVPVARVEESPVYELPLKKGAELSLPVPGAGVVLDDGDVAVAGDSPSCKLRLNNLEYKENHDMEVTLLLAVEGVPFDLSDFELLDGKGKPLSAVSASSYRTSSEKRMEWNDRITVRNVAEMKQLRVRLKYRTGVRLSPVPVDVKLGLGGPVSQQGKAVRR